MQLYQIRYIDDAAPEGGMFKQQWVGTQADLRTAAKAAQTEGMRNIEKLDVNVPTDKAGLLAFLNERGVR